MPVAINLLGRLADPIRFFVPPASFGIAAIPVSGFMYESWGIVVFQVYFLIGVWLAFLTARDAAPRTRAMLIALGVTMIGSQLVFLVNGHKLMSSYEIGEMRELSISFTLAAYSLWLFLKTRSVAAGARS